MTDTLSDRIGFEGTDNSFIYEKSSPGYSGLGNNLKVEDVKEKLHEVGCRICGMGGRWRIFTDGQEILEAECHHCGHRIKFPPELKEEQDQKAIPLRMFL